MTELDARYWNERYRHSNTPWDLGSVSPPLRDYIDQLQDRELRILIPGAGHAHEAYYLLRRGFQHVYVCDWAPAAREAFLQDHPEFPANQWLTRDFFKLEGAFDLILEQTFFCALPPDQRQRYVHKVHELLRPEGRLVGVLFAHPFESPGPPFGGTEEEYRNLFSPLFTVHKMELANNSVSPRANRELWIELQPNT